jgi:DNA replication protein DnaC
MKIEQETARAVCETCCKEFERPVFRVGEKEIFRVRECPKCNARREQRALAMANQERQQAAKEPYWRICPPRYRNFNRSLLPIADETIDRVLNWRPKTGSSADGRGLALTGPAHVAKRRLLFALGEDLFHDGLQIAYISAPDFEALAPLRYDRESGAAVRKRLSQLRSSQILILTDLGAERLTESSQHEFYNLVEHRAQRCRPILWSTQFSREQVAARFVSSNGPEIALARRRAAVDRLNEVSDVIEVEWKSATSLQESAKLHGLGA